MTDAPRPDIAKSKVAAQTLLAAHADEIVQDTTALYDVLNRGTYNLSLPAFIAWDPDDGDGYIDLPLEHRPLPDPVTMQYYLDFIAHNELSDPFLGTDTRMAAINACADKYFDEVDVADMANQTTLKVNGALRKFHDYIDAITALAERGERPSPTSLRGGVEVMQALALRYKSQQAEKLDKSKSGSAIEDAYYNRELNGLFLDAHNGFTPHYIDDATADRISDYWERRHGKQPYTQEDKDLKQHLDELIRMHGDDPGKAELLKHRNDFKKEVSPLGMRTDIMLHLIQETSAIAKELGISMNTRERAGG